MPLNKNADSSSKSEDTLISETRILPIAPEQFDKETLVYFVAKGDCSEVQLSSIASDELERVYGCTQLSGYQPISYLNLFQIAVINGHAETALALNARGAEVNQADSNGRAPSHWTSVYGHTETSQALNKIISFNACVAEKYSKYYIDFRVDDYDFSCIAELISDIQIGPQRRQAFIACFSQSSEIEGLIDDFAKALTLHEIPSLTMFDSVLIKYNTYILQGQALGRLAAKGGAHCFIPDEIASKVAEYLEPGCLVLDTRRKLFLSGYHLQKNRSIESSDAEGVVDASADSTKKRQGKDKEWRFW